MNPVLPITAAAIAAITLLLPSCNTVTGEQTTIVSAERGVPGGRVQQTTEVSATVAAIDGASRKVTLETKAGERLSVTAGPEVANFNQIRVGDQLVVTYVEEVLVRMAGSGEKVQQGSTLAGAVNAPGDKPGAAIGEATQGTATVTEIDARRRKVRLQFSDGTSKKISVRDDIDLSKHKVGEVVVIRYTEALAVKVRTP